MRHCNYWMILWASMGVVIPALGDVSLKAPFSDHMVLQRRMAVPVWGMAAAGEAVTVAFRGQNKTATAGTDGKWRVTLDATEAGGPFTMTVQGKNALTLQDVLVGEVWLAGGQSNMAFNMNTFSGPNLDSAKAANYPNLRFMTFTGNGKWNACTPATVPGFSTTGFYFGKDLHQALNVPVGIIVSAQGGTEAERWMDPAAVAADAAIAKDADAGALYRQWIMPMETFAIKGVIWYQGESNAHITYPAHPAWTTATYTGRFKALIQGWRRTWKQGDFPFCFVQLPNINGSQGNAGETSEWAELREAQRLALAVPNTAMAVTIDIGGDLHPINKWDVGKRLSLAARGQAYGEAGLVHSGPLYQSMQIQGRNVRLAFRYAQGMKPKSGAKVTGFAIAGADNKWNWADAAIEGETMVVTSAAVAAPTKVRYAWGNNPACNLINAAGLLASPFRTDGSQLPVALAPMAGRLPGAAFPSAGWRGAPFSDVLGRETSRPRTGKAFPIH
jgi:sialate O-acetylesterase